MITCILKLFFFYQLTEINESHLLSACFYTSLSQKIYDRLDFKNSPINAQSLYVHSYVTLKQ